MRTSTDITEYRMGIQVIILQILKMQTKYSLKGKVMHIHFSQSSLNNQNWYNEKLCALDWFKGCLWIIRDSSSPKLTLNSWRVPWIAFGLQSLQKKLLEVSMKLFLRLRKDRCSKNIDGLVTKSGGNGHKTKLPSSMSLYLGCHQKVLLRFRWDFLLQIIRLRKHFLSMSSYLIL